jgi:hypothetical protein
MGHLQADGQDIQTDNNSWPWICDWNEDGRKDLLVGQEGISQPCNVYVYMNEGSNAAPVFGDSTPILFNGTPSTYWRTIPVLQDLDLDGKKDMILGGWYSDVRFYTNVGTNASPVFTNYIYLVQPDSQNYSNGNPPRINFTDWDGDGDLDMITCDYYGSVFLRENVTPQSVVENTTGAIESIGLTVTPNPFSTTTQIRYLIHDTEYLIGNATLRVYDTEGRLVKSFNTVSSVQDQESRISWSGSDDANRKLGSGVYFVTLRTNRGTLTEKILITR